MSDPDASTIMMFYIPVPNEETGQELVLGALERKLAACGNLLGPAQSFYVWEGEPKHESEYILVLKTSLKKSDSLRKYVVDAHPYECPGVSSFPVEANKVYFDWVIAHV